MNVPPQSEYPKKRIICPLDKLPTKPLDSEIYSITVLKPTTDCSNTDIEIKISAELIFTKGTINCKRIRIISSPYVNIQNLTLHGVIHVEESYIAFTNCDITCPKSTYDYLLSLNRRSTCLLLNCNIHNSPLSGICVDLYSKLDMFDSTVSDFETAILHLTGHSECRLINSTLTKARYELICVESMSICFLHNSHLSSNSRIGVYIQEASFSADSSIFSNNQQGAITAYSSKVVTLNNCQILDSKDTAILLHDASISLTNCVIDVCDGNGINSSFKSSVSMSNCIFRNTDWPFLAFCESSNGVVSNCLFENSKMSGVIVRSDSSVTMKNSIVRQCAEAGVRVCSSKSANFINCTFGNTKSAAFESCDESIVHLTDCSFFGPFPQAINIFSGGSIIAKNLSIVGPYQSAFWIHHGGSFLLFKAIISNRKQPISYNKIHSFFGALEQISQLPIHKSIFQFYTFHQPKYIPFYNPSLPESAQQENYKLLSPQNTKENQDNKKENTKENQDNKKENTKENKENTSNTTEKIKDDSKLEYQAPILLRTKNPITDNDNRLFLVETTWPVIGSNLFVYGIGYYDFIGNPQSVGKIHDFTKKIPCPCLQCGKPTFDLHYIYCGHSLYCSDCWNKMENKPKTCLLCKLEIKGAAPSYYSSVDDNNICSICCTNEVDSVILPCGHIICKECSRSWYSENDDCPFCRNSATQTRPLVTYG